MVWNMRVPLLASLIAVGVAGCAEPPPPPAPAAVEETPAPQIQPAPDQSQTQSDGTSVAWGELSNITELPHEGVSAHLEFADSGYRLFYASMTEGGQVVSMCDSELSCETQAVLDRMSDLTVVMTGAGTRQGYWVEMNPDTKMKEIYSGEIAEDATAVLERNPLGYSGDISWGVPDAVALPDGRVRIYWVEPGEGRASEKIVSATSRDESGTTFELDPGFRLEGGWVDFEVLRAIDGDWLAIMSSSPETLPESPQGLFLARSADGLDWEINPESLTPSDMSYLDPTGVLEVDGTITVVMSVAPNALGTRDYTLAQATLALK
jgi:hypothetical protein